MFKIPIKLHQCWWAGEGEGEISLKRQRENPISRSSSLQQLARLCAAAVIIASTNSWNKLNSSRVTTACTQHKYHILYSMSASRVWERKNRMETSKTFTMEICMIVKDVCARWAQFNIFSATWEITASWDMKGGEHCVRAVLIWLRLPLSWSGSGRRYRRWLAAWSWPEELQRCGWSQPSALGPSEKMRRKREGRKEVCEL